ncbi:SseB family protein [Microbacterium sp. H1-D42]|uniref:SseB family protein n=1 Tax=Microbacterium sp. H1-D42 TaxID=2925844 RepID=UPI001F52E63C|nr:SseB family protein [Microbacterium sp. H1-D42]UNK70044.1 SseB family protein [Microbacterium sp. H1-D42]
MALFSRRKKSDAQPASDAEVAPEQADLPEQAEDAAAEVSAEPAPDANIPAVNISVQAFRGVGADAGPEVALPTEDAAPAKPADTDRPRTPAPPMPGEQAKPSLPLAAATPPEQKHTVDGLNDNVLLREALAELEEGASNEQLIGVMRQSLQGHLYLRVHGDAREQLNSGKPLAVGVVRDGERSFMLAYSSGKALRDSVDGSEDAASTSAIAQPVTAVYQQVVSGDFAGIILDNSSAPHRAVFPTELLQKALEQGDAEMAIKTQVVAPRDEQTPVRVAEALAKTRSWVAVNDGSNGQPVGIAEVHGPDGTRFLQVFSHPLEVVALGRNDRPMPFQPEQLAKVLSDHPEIAGVIVDIAGPSLAVGRDSLSAVLVLAIDIED